MIESDHDIVEVQSPLQREENSRIVRVKIKQRQSLITRVNLLKPNTIHLDELSLKDVEARLALLERHYNALDELQSEIEFLDETQFEGDIRSVVDDTYCEVKAAYAERLALLRTCAEELPLSSTVAQQSVPSSRTQFNLPKLKLPSFDGSHREWLDFRSMFSVMVDKNPALSDVEKFQYLRSSLTGGAASLVQSLEVTSLNYKRAMELLQARYDHKRYIYQSHVHHIFEIHRVATPSVKALRDFVDVINANIRALQSMATPEQIGNSLLLHLVVSKLDQETQLKWEEEIAARWDRESSSTAIELPTWDDLAAFLERRCQLIDIIDATAKSTKTSHQQHANSSPVSSSMPKHQPQSKQLAFIATKQQNCSLCDQPVFHNAFKCSPFMKLSSFQRYDVVKKKNLCLNCLGQNHTSKQCPSTHRCQVCRESHHTLLHRNSTSAANEQSSTSSLTPPSTSMHSTSVPASLQVCIGSQEVLLATAIVQLRSSSGALVLARALLDSASQLHFITERMAQLLRLKREKVPLEISGIGLCGARSQFLCKVEMRSQHTAYSSTMDAVIMNTITPSQPRTPLNTSAWNIPNNISLADKTFKTPCPVDLLIGASMFYDLLLVGQISLGENKPVLQKTKVGWVVAGAVTNHPLLSSATLVSSYTTSIATDCMLSNSRSSLLAANAANTSAPILEPSLDQILEKFWHIEHYPDQTQSNLTIDERECEKYFEDTTKRCPTTNKFIVRLPCKEPPQSLGTSYDIALKRLLAIENKLRHNRCLERDYNSFMKEYIALHHMIHVPFPDACLNYIPHHAVMKLDSSTTKLRVVFDASCRTSNGKSLNDILRVGPTIQDDLVSILIRFRQHSFVLMADITKMYRQIIVDKEDTNLQCILWRDEITDRIKTYKLQTVTYGTACAPYLAINCLQQLARDHMTSHPIGASVIANDFYVDNLMTGAPTIEEVIEIKQQVIEVLNKGGFPLRKFATNDPSIIADVAAVDREDIIQVEDVGYVKALGLKWSPSLDSFLFSYTQPPVSSKLSKRIILSHIARFFDPLGLLNPLMVTCKILLQQLWKLRLNWDESVPQSIYTQWESFCTKLPLVENLRVNRLVACDYNSTIHAFADASTRAYGATIYVVSNSTSALLCAKSRVAPTKGVSLPRLELSAAVLLAELLEFVCKKIHHNPRNVHCWTDSMITLAWIKGDPSKWTTFVSNRVTKIQLLTQHYHWHHVPSELNPADILSRGTKADKFIENSLWFHGPHFLTQDAQHWPLPSCNAINDNNIPEQRRQNIVLLTNPTTDIISEHKFVTSYNKLLRIMCYVRRFADASRGIRTNQDSITASEINDALLIICRIVQSNKFFDELSKLQKDRLVHRKSPLSQLSPFLCNGIIRVGGRLKNSSLTFNEKHPIVLPKSHPFVHTLIMHLHQQHLHAGCQTLLTIIREKFWIVNARNTIKRVLHKCIVCYRFRPILSKQLMGDLPRDRVIPSPPFEKTGVDYCGPLLITQRIRGRPPIKVYIAIFICFSTKGVHLELVPDLTTDAFIAALRRFMARRGKCRIIYSDNATNFVGANRELRELLHQHTSQQHADSVQAACCTDGVEWKFIPPRSPHFGGLWESAVKQAKHYLRRAVGVHILTFDELYTICCQTEAMINSRPPMPMSSSPDDLRPLTPAHLIIGRSLSSIPEQSLTSVNTGTLKRYQLIQWIQQQFWARWSKDYLQELQCRKRWKSPMPNIQKGDLVLLQEDNTPPFKWPMGGILDTIEGSDGKVRVVIIKTAESTHKRAITRVAKLPISQCN
ncbi:uncharacterized protein LOC128867038 [Anastrepha ludens]|uniref:uncharacterized protein LOC128867038 n=1 Tax=Anastrepha ludens TaxID=28586 RepID=UPI0023B093B1|nr:uncharacterized protein LOC128867038 [Anastrepha ludens]